MPQSDVTSVHRVWELMDQIEACLTRHPKADAATHEALDQLRSYAVTVLLGFGDEMPPRGALDSAGPGDIPVEGRLSVEGGAVGPSSTPVPRCGESQLEPVCAPVIL